MKAIRIAGGLVAAALAIGFPLGMKNANAYQRGSPQSDEQMEILTRGPVHEAFAETVTFDPEPGIIAPKAPPAAIEEVPPEQRPQGKNVAWIPGYWAWDDERSDFLWVSGVWRALPPGRQWVPGYWSRATKGVQWISGYWADAAATEVEYLPEPPASVEAGPSTAATSADQIWHPGSWLWQQNRYAWSPGYWAAGQTNWNWIPPHYIWTPRGYVFVDGYHDYSVGRRGVLFAPVYFRDSAYAQRGFSYSPLTAINASVFSNHLFVRPSYGHYYFGDYYGSNYASAGYTPGFSYNSSRYGYDPIYAQDRWTNRQNRAWEKSYQSNYQNRFDNENARPPRTWADQRARVAKTGINQQNIGVATSLDDLSNSQESALRFQKLDAAERQQYTERQQLLNQQREQRQQLEIQAKENLAAAHAAREFQRTKLKYAPSPISSQPLDRFDPSDAPPKPFATSPLDSKTAPHPRKPREASTVRPETKSTSPTIGPHSPKLDPSPAPQPRVEPRPVPRVEPKPAPKDAPKPQSELPNLQPMVTKPQPRPEVPQREPKVNNPPTAKAPHASPRPEPKKVNSQPDPKQPSGGEPKKK